MRITAFETQGVRGSRFTGLIAPCNSTVYTSVVVGGVPACKETLEADTVMALEPKLWHDGEYYLRVEDIVLVGQDGAEILTSFDREVFEL